MTKEEKRKKAGLCVRCGREPPAPARVSCVRCLARMRVRAKTQYQARVASGKCGLCGQPQAPGSVCCKRCLTRLREYGKLQKRDAVEAARVARGNACERCGWEEIPEILEFHHWRGTGSRQADKRPWNQALKEVAQGTDTDLAVVCPNCHRELHFRRLRFNPRTKKHSPYWKDQP